MTSVSELSPGTWTVDPSHSEVGFVARHLMVSKVRGQFKEFEATVTSSATASTSTVAGHRAAGQSIDTGSADRDAHLTSADFFDADELPDDDLHLHRCPPTARLLLTATSPSRASPAGAPSTWTSTASRPTRGAAPTRRLRGRPPRSTARTSAWTWNVALEGGGVLVGEKVKIVLDVQLVKA